MNIGEEYNPFKLFHGCFIPNWLLCRTEISQGAKLCFARLSQFAGKEGKCFPHLTTLAEELGVSTRMIQTYLAELRNFKLIESGQQNGRGNEYIFLWHEWIDALRPCHEEFFVPATKNISPPSIYIRESIKENQVNIKEIQRKGGTSPLPMQSEGKNIRSSDDERASLSKPKDQEIVDIEKITREEVAVCKTNQAVEKIVVQKTQKAIDEEKEIRAAFEEFWKAYPRKQGKEPAYRIWLRKKLHKIKKEILDDIAFRKANRQPNGWREVRSGSPIQARFIQMPETYLNQERWNDEFCEGNL